MQRTISTAILIAIFGGGGWMFFKGLHLEDIQQILVSGRSATEVMSSDNPVGELSTRLGVPAAASAWSPQPQDTIRIASFNIQVFGLKKASKPHVMAEIGRIFSQFDLVAIQEIRTQDDQFIPSFVQNLNQYTGKTYHYRVGPRLGNTTSTEQYAFVFDSAKIMIHPHFLFTVGDPDNLLHREPHVGLFTIRGVDPARRFTFMLVNLHTDPHVAQEEMDALAQVYRVLRRQPISRDQLFEDDVILLGDFNIGVPEGRPLSRSDLAGLGQIDDIYPVIQHQTTNTIRTKLHDNILIHRPSTAEFRKGGVYDFQALHGLSLEQAKQVSDHFPVWAEFSIYESTLSNHVARDSSATTR